LKILGDGNADDQEERCESCELTGLNRRSFAKQKKIVEAKAVDGTVGRRQQRKIA